MRLRLRKIKLNEPCNVDNDRNREMLVAWLRDMNNLHGCWFMGSHGSPPGGPIKRQWYAEYDE